MPHVIFADATRAVGQRHVWHFLTNLHPEEQGQKIIGIIDDLVKRLPPA